MMEYEEWMVSQLGRVVGQWITNGEDETVMWLSIAEHARRAAITLEELKHIPKE